MNPPTTDGTVVMRKVRQLSPKFSENTGTPLAYDAIVEPDSVKPRIENNDAVGTLIAVRSRENLHGWSWRSSPGTSGDESSLAKSVSFRGIITVTKFSGFQRRRVA